jgi:hypothetical protein
MSKRAQVILCDKKVTLPEPKFGENASRCMRFPHRLPLLPWTEGIVRRTTMLLPSQYGASPILICTQETVTDRNGRVLSQRAQRQLSIIDRMRTSAGPREMSLSLSVLKKLVREPAMTYKVIHTGVKRHRKMAKLHVTGLNEMMELETMYPFEEAQIN